MEKAKTITEFMDELNKSSAQRKFKKEYEHMFEIFDNLKAQVEKLKKEIYEQDGFISWLTDGDSGALEQYQEELKQTLKDNQ